jgi:hypothetical protein
MRRRWAAVCMLVAENQSLCIIGYRDLANLFIAVEQHTLLTHRPRTARRSPARYRLTINP